MWLYRKLWSKMTGIDVCIHIYIYKYICIYTYIYIHMPVTDTDTDTDTDIDIDTGKMFTYLNCINICVPIGNCAVK